LAERLLEIARQKAEAHGLANLQFETGDMERLGYPDDYFDAVVSVFSIFFVPDMARQVRELWRMVRPDLVNTVSPWDRITEPQAVRDLLREAGIVDVEVVAEDGYQTLRSPDDWWTIVLGSGFRWTVEQLGRDAAERVRSANLAQMRRSNVKAAETNAIFATARKSA
jgi:SAM-dependent methyltransferase